MRKKIISILLGVILCCSMFGGCALIEHNDEKDMQQVIAVIDPITDTSTNGITYTSQTKYIYKRDLNSALVSYAQAYMSNYNMSLQEVTERLLQELITRELLFIEAERLEVQGEIEWTQEDENDKKKYVYSWIDSQLQSLRNEILSGFNEATISTDNNEESTSTTYPTPDAETTDEKYEYYERDEKGNFVMVDKIDKDGNVVYVTEKDAQGNTVYEKDADGNPDLSKPKYQTDKDGNRIPEKVHKIIVWEPSRMDYPCLWGDEDRKSLDREAVQRFVSLVKKAVASDFKVTAEDKALFAEDDKALDAAISKGWEFVYPVLGNTHYIEYIIGTSARQSLMLTKLQNYIVNGVTVTDEEVVNAYKVQRQQQINTYTDDASAYRSAFTGGSTTMLYMRDDSCFYVKHILLPFSDEQVADMKAYQADPKNAGKDYTVMRDTQMVNETVVYPHVHGENDMSAPKTVQAVYNEIYSAMQKVKSSPKEAERLFDEFTYKYNTDPGSFGYGKGYAVERNSANNSGYMEEFYKGAIKLYDNYKVGEVLPELVVTDYGVHIMYFAQAVATPGYVRELTDYLTPGAYQTIYDTFRDTLKTNKENNAFSAWSDERIVYYQDNEKVVHTYEKRYKSLYE